MKFAQGNEGFKPVTITLESMAEVRLFAALLGDCSDTDIVHATQGTMVDTYGLFSELDDICESEFGRLEIKVSE